MFCSEIEVFRQDKGHILHNKGFTVETGKRQTQYGRSMTKEKSSEIFEVKI